MIAQRIARMASIIVFLGLVLVAAMATAHGAEWQFAVSAGSKPNQRAWLWIPPNCQYVKGLVLAQQVILENNILEGPIIRAMAAEENLALVIVCPAFDGEFDYKNSDAAGMLQKILDDLAHECGYTEIAAAPLLPIGHSGSGIFAWMLAYWNPSRVFGVVSIKSAAQHPPAFDPKASVDGVPILAISGQYESYGDPENSLEHHWRWLRGTLLDLRAKTKRGLMSELVEPGAGHFGWYDELAQHVALFISTAAQHRIPNEIARGQPIVLRTLDLRSGWLTDHIFVAPSEHPPAPYSKYTGDTSLAFWHINERLARATENFGRDRKGKREQMVTFVEGGQLLKGAWLQTLKFNPSDDGLTVRVAGNFLERAPTGVAEAGQPLGHAEGPVRFRLIGGWAGGGEQIGDNRFRLRFGHFGITARADNIMLMAYHPGDAFYRYAEQPAQIKFPLYATAGRPQTITFPEVNPIKAGTPAIELTAISDENLPIDYCVIRGPAEVRGHTLYLTDVPPRSPFPVKIEVLAYQWGRSLPPLVQTAEPVTRIILLDR